MRFKVDQEIKIKTLETFSTNYVSVVRLTMDDGSQGWGQMSTYCSDITTQIFHRQVAPHAISKVFMDFEDMENLILEREHKFPGSYLLRAIAGLDTALWDWLGRKSELPVTSLIGGSPGKVPAYASSMKRHISPKDEAKRFSKLRDEFGFRAFKFRVGAECGRGLDEWPGRSEEIIVEVPKSLGAGIKTMVDANSCYSAEQAIELGKKIIDNGVSHFEEPCPYWLPEETRKVTEALEIDVTGGEQDCDLRIWKDMIDRKIVDIVQPDVMYMGGLTRSLDVARMAELSEVICTPHTANLSLVTVCTMHFLKALKNGGEFLEFSIEGEDYYPWQKNFFASDPFAVDNGDLTIHDTPGWGVEFNQTWLDKATYQCSAKND
jgi:L-alanine-DL-glutamate epimerase-like enolase superfamily enzyme